MSKLLTINEAAKELGVSVKTIRRWEKAGRITSQRTAGGHRRFDVGELADQARENQRQYFSSLQVILAILTTLLATAFITNIAASRYHSGKRAQILEQVLESLTDPANRQMAVETGQTIDSLPSANVDMDDSNLVTALGGEQIAQVDSDNPDVNSLVPIINKNPVSSGIAVMSGDQKVAFVVFAGLVTGDVASVVPTSDSDSSLAVVDYVEGGGFLVARLDNNSQEVYFNWTVYR